MPWYGTPENSESSNTDHRTVAPKGGGFPLPGSSAQRHGKTGSVTSAARGGRTCRGTILLVDDEEMVRGFVRMVLEGDGYHVLEAGTPEELDYLREHHHGAIDLLLTDVVMPGRSGPEVSELLRSEYPHLKVLYMSGHTDDAVFRQGVRLAAIAFIQKPFSPSALAQKVQELLA